MANVTFKIKADISEAEWAQILDVVRALPGVDGAGAIKADARTKSLRRLHYVHVSARDAGKVAERLRKLPELEKVEVPPTRRLVGEGS